MPTKLSPTHKQIADFLIDNIINEMMQFLMEDYDYSLDEALNIIYTSDVMRMLEQVEDELYLQSSSYVYELLIKEKGLFPVAPNTVRKVADIS